MGYGGLVVCVWGGFAGARVCHGEEGGRWGGSGRPTPVRAEASPAGRTWRLHPAPLPPLPDVPSSVPPYRPSHPPLRLTPPHPPPPVHVPRACTLTHPPPPFPSSASVGWALGEEALQDVAACADGTDAAARDALRAAPGPRRARAASPARPPPPPPHRGAGPPPPPPSLPPARPPRAPRTDPPTHGPRSLLPSLPILTGVCHPYPPPPPSLLPMTTPWPSRSPP